VEERGAGWCAGFARAKRSSSCVLFVSAFDLRFKRVNIVQKTNNTRQVNITPPSTHPEIHPNLI